ncbi:MAG: phenylacetate-CoA oxygenase subunit PaaJ [Acidothermus sp.]|nr:phenylacetate-CoA oxygenase subunit PaaJ [Acidothermus sp.]
MAETVDELRRRLAAIPDPELPALTIADLGILRSVKLIDDRLEVRLTPTYFGCPAFEAIRGEVRRVLDEAGYPSAKVEVEYAPAWSTDDVTEAGRRRLAEAGIAPPPPTGTRAGEVGCPRCGSRETEMLSRFGSTPCQAVMRCVSCGEPFPAMKAH